jgi:hypothetical protein
MIINAEIAIMILPVPDGLDFVEFTAGRGKPHREQK